MVTIEIDREVLDVLKSRAEPFVDTPNDVLRRVFGLDAVRAERTRPPKRRSSSSPAASTEAFIKHILDAEFSGEFRIRSPYRTMYESQRQIVYFQNFNSSGTANLWYRLKGSALDLLVSSSKEAYVVFTNPAEGISYAVPAAEIKRRADRKKWDRADLEVNIDPATGRWRELDWDLTDYLRRPG